MWFFSEEHCWLQSSVRQFAQKQLAPRVEALDELEEFNREAFYRMGELGLLGLTVSEEDGGAGMDAVAATLAFQEIAAVDASMALSYLAHSILCVHQIAKNASLEQKKRYLPGLIQGETLGGMGMSEPDAGSDVLGMKTYATLEGDVYRLQGSKTWITNAPCGDVFYCYAKTAASHGVPGKRSISTFILEKGMEGFSTGKKFSKMGMRASPTGELIFSNCRVPQQNRVGLEGESVNQMMANLDLERITLSGISLGIARSCLDVATRYSQERKAFQKPIGAFQQIQLFLAEASSWYEACQSLVYQAAKVWDLGHQASRIAAEAKLQSAQMATQVALDAIQILGGYGYTREFPVERYMRDAKLLEIGGGTNEILRKIIARHMLGKEIAEA